MASTGTTNATPGLYKSSCDCQKEMKLGFGDTFPPCPQCGQSVFWKLLQRG